MRQAEMTVKLGQGREITVRVDEQDGHVFVDGAQDVTISVPTRSLFPAGTAPIEISEDDCLHFRVEKWPGIRWEMVALRSSGPWWGYSHAPRILVVAEQGERIATYAKGGDSSREHLLGTRQITNPAKATA